MNKILIGYNQLLCAEAVLNGQFKLSLFEDLNRLIEAVILYDKIVLLGQYDVSSNQLYKELSKANIIESIEEDSILQIIEEPANQTLLNKKFRPVFNLNSFEVEGLDLFSLIQKRENPNASAQNTINIFATTIPDLENKGDSINSILSTWLRENVYEKRYQGGHFGYFARSLIYDTIAEVNEMDYSPDFLRLPISALNFSNTYRSIPRILYEELSLKFESEIRALASLGMPVPFFIPPLMAKVLSTKVPLNQFILEVFSLRDEFQSFREKYNEFRSLLKSSDVSIKDKIKAKNSFFTSILGIVKKGETGHALNVKTVWDKVAGAKLNEEGEFDASLSVAGLASIIVSQVQKEKTKGRARAIFDLWTDSLNIKNYGSLIQTYFKTEIDKNEIDFLTSYSNSVRATLRN